MESWSTHHFSQQASARLDISDILQMLPYINKLRENNLPVIFSLAHLGKIIGVDYDFLHKTVNRKNESSNYKLFAIKKRTGGRRFIHAVNGKLYKVQKYLNDEVLQKIQPHPMSFAFHSSGGIKQCAEIHCGCRWLLNFDLKDFFYSISELATYNVFLNIGFKPLLAFELARLCTTMRLPNEQKHYIKLRKIDMFSSEEQQTFPYPIYPWLGVLPQGAPTSPMLSNLVAKNLDEDLYEYSQNNNFIYSRYADDLTFSAFMLPSKSIALIKREIIHIIRKNGFYENPDKTHIAGPGSRKVVLGLLVDGMKPRLLKQTRLRIEQHIYCIEKFGINSAASFHGFESAYGYFNHISGLMAFINDVDKDFWERLKDKFEKIKIDLNI